MFVVTEQRSELYYTEVEEHELPRLRRGWEVYEGTLQALQHKYTWLTKSHALDREKKNSQREGS